MTNQPKPTEEFVQQAVAQIALRGYSYQFLYSCNLILSSGTDIIFSLEGIEDIDTIKCSDGKKIWLFRIYDYQYSGDLVRLVV